MTWGYYPTKPEFTLEEYELYLLKIQARGRLNYAIKKGHIKRKPCETCGAEKVEAHHTDYTKALDVTWLCKPCHTKAHYARTEGEACE